MESRLHYRIRPWLGACLLSLLLPLQAHASCSAPANAIEAENCLPGTPWTTWDLPNADAGDLTIQGFTTNISVNVGDTVNFKVSTPASSWHLDIYRMGYYGGNGARLITTVTPSVPLPQSQPACLVDTTAVLPSNPPAATTTGLVDCGNWTVSASWAVPTTATSGIYFAKATRDDTGGASHIMFIVRNDASHSDILFQASDTSWQAYNPYSPNFYGCTNPGSFDDACRAYKISYNRPFLTRSFEPETWVFGEEYPMVKWLEANGYDVTYFTDTDTDRNGALLLNHKIWMSNGHDEYWSGNQRAAAEAARAAGVSLAFFSSNSVYWKTRWENSIDGSGTPYRTLVCFKETWANAAIDPLPTTWTGTWRDPRFSPPKDGGRPENALIGTITRIAGNTYATMMVPQADGLMRFWRNTNMATLSPGQTYTLPAGTLGEELMADEDNGYRPSGLFHLSTTIVNSPGNYLIDYGTNVSAGTMTHNLTLYRASSGALVFSASTYDWSWGLDSDHDLSNLGPSTDVNMQQATVNLLADMGVQPATLVTVAVNSDGFGPLTQAAASTDTTPPTSLIVSPNSSTALAVGTQVTISGTATDVGGAVAGVEVSTNGGGTWHPASGRGNWTYSWTPTLAGAVNILSRAVDDSGNLETPSAGVTVTVSGTSGWSLWPLKGGSGIIMSSAPGVVDVGPDSSLELGLNFYSDTNGFISGIRFYKASTNTGTHTGSLWSTSSGTVLATATFTNESPSGWQQVNFSTPVAITANQLYMASYHTTVGHYSDDQYYFIGNGVDNAPLHAMGTTASSFNGGFAYGTSSVYPNSPYLGSNYWVDVVFTTTAPPPPTLKSIALSPTGSTIVTGATQQFTATGTYSDGSTQNVSSQAAWTSSNTGVATVISGTGLATAVGAGTTTISAALNGVTGSTSLTVQAGALSVTTSSLPGGVQGAAYATTTLAATGGTLPYTWSIVSGSLPPGLSLSGAGVLSGTPTAIGSFSFTVQAADSSSPKKTATAALSIVVSVQTSSIWPSTTVPAVVDSGPDGAVELGVKFTSNVNGLIYGIRFYKASTNTGTHVGNLWSSTGTKLATATFTGESSSGWQQVNFASPVAINANTVYVASYHSTIGHYSNSSAYFATSGVTNGALTALANGTSGPDGVYAYGASSIFPSSGYNSTNYWVDIAFVAAPPAPLSVTTASLPNGAPGTAYSATLAATGGTTPYTWSLASGALPAGLSLNSSTGVISGTPTIAGTSSFSVQATDSTSPTHQTATAALSIVVAVPALSVTTTSLPAAVTGATYSATLAASGGTTPYTWSIASGALPAGLSLASSTGVISGTPTTAGTSGFSVQATDSTNPTHETATAALSIVVSSTASYSIWPATAAPTTVDSGPDSAVELGVKFTSSVAGHVAGVRFYKASTNTGTHTAHLWSSSGTSLASATFSGETASGWQQVKFATPVAITAGTVYVVSYHTTVGHYSDDQNFFATTGVTSGPLTALANGTSGADGVYAYGTSSSFPSSGYISSNYWVDVLFQVP